MTSTSITNLTSAEPSRSLITRRGWVWIGVLSVLFLLFHRTFVWRTVRIAMSDHDWSHALIVPLLSIYFIYQHRRTLSQTPRRLCWWGLPVFISGLFGYAAGIYPIRNDMAQGYSMILALFGMTLFLLGPATMRTLWFPIAYLVFSVKISDRIWSQIAWQLQQIAARGATVALKLFGAALDFDVANRGSTIDLTFVRNGTLVTEALNVAEACSGLRMLMAFVALAVALAFLWKTAWWQRVTFIVMAVPIAVLVNIGRVTALGLLFLIDPQLARGTFHQYVGLFMLLPALALFLLLGWVLDRIFIVEHAPPSEAAPPVSDAIIDEAPRTPGSVRPRLTTVLRGTAVGVLLILLLGAIYGLVLKTVRPDLLWTALPQPAVWGLLAVATALVALIAWQLPRRLMPAASGCGLLARRTLAAGMVTGILLAGLGVQLGVLHITRAVLLKKPVPLRHPLLLMPTAFGSWELYYEAPPLGAEELEALGSDEYISRIYRDTSWPTTEPGGMAQLHVVYYTGTPDTVPHVPDRCFVAGGAQGMGTTTQTLSLQTPVLTRDAANGDLLSPAQLEPTVRVPADTVNATVFSFVAPNRTNSREHVVYFFVANGKFLTNPDMVRLHGFDPRDRYSYYCKVEVRTIGVDDQTLAVRRAEALLREAMPDILACLPDWVDVTEGRWPGK